MALIKCAECGTDISNQAPTCPKCGAPLSVAAPKPKTRSRIWLWIFVVIVVGIIVVNFPPDSGSGISKSVTRTRWAPSHEDIAKQPDRKKLIDKMGRAGLWSKWESCETIDVCLWIRAPFYALDIDQKHDFVQLFWSYHAIQAKSDVISVHLRDAASGKDVGIYERQKLTMK